MWACHLEENNWQHLLQKIIKNRIWTFKLKLQFWKTWICYWELDKFSMPKDFLMKLVVTLTDVIFFLFCIMKCVNISKSYIYQWMKIFQITVNVPKWCTDKKSHPKGKMRQWILKSQSIKCSFITVISDFRLKLRLKKLPLIELWCISKRNIGNYLKRLPKCYLFQVHLCVRLHVFHLFQPQPLMTHWLQQQAGKPDCLLLGRHWRYLPKCKKTLLNIFFYFRKYLFSIEMC